MSEQQSVFFRGVSATRVARLTLWMALVILASVGYGFLLSRLVDFDRTLGIAASVASIFLGSLAFIRAIFLLTNKSPHVVPNPK